MRVHPYCFAGLLWFALTPHLDQGQWILIPDSPTGIECFSGNADSLSLFAGTHFGLFRSTDQGSSWLRASAGISNPDVSALYRQPPFLWASMGGRIFRTTDEGETWSEVFTLGWTVSSFVIAPDSDGSQSLFAGTRSMWVGQGGVLRSTDFGDTWVSAGLDSISVYALAVAPKAPGSETLCLYAATNPGIYASSDGGRSWFLKSNSINLVRSFVLDTTGSGGASLYAGTFFSGIFRSTDFGATWESINQGLPAQTIRAMLALPSFEPGGRPPLLAAVSGHGVFQFSQVTNTWSPVNENLDTSDVRALGASHTYVFAGSSLAAVFRRPTGDLVTQVREHQPAQLHNTILRAGFPNPFNGRTTIQFELSQAANVSVDILDVLGRHVCTLCNDMFPPGTHELTWETGGESSGTYFCRLKTERTTQVRLLQLLK
jgi:photosystem II stability/assembly factor-like uncharacterized protein